MVKITSNLYESGLASIYLLLMIYIIPVNV